MHTETRIEYIATIREMVEELQNNLDNPPGFRELAERAYLSPYHFHRVFRAMVGESPAEFVRRLRLERAAYQIRRTKDSITEIAFGAGYATHEAFTKAFQAAFSVNPSGFRKGSRDCFGIQARNNVHVIDGGFTLFNLIDHGVIDMKTEVLHRDRQRIVGLHHKGPYHEIGEAFQRLGPKAGQLGLFAMPNAFGVAIYLDDPETKPASELDSVAGVCVPEGVPIGDMDESHLSEGRYFKAEFVGHYGGLGEAWGAVLGKLIPEGGYQLRDGLMFEVYLNDCNVTPADELQTDIYVAIA